MQYSIKTDIGVVRSENQDRAVVFENNGIVLAILCDGMGGHVGGSHASSITVATFEKEFEKIKTKKIEVWFASTLKKAKKAMIRFAGSNIKLLDMGTTITAALILQDEIYVFNVGDSRTYVYNGILHQITKDHNLRNHYIKKFGYSPEEAARVPGAAALTAALGPKKTVSLDTLIVKRSEGVQKVILTCDGIHDYVSKPQFEKIIGDNFMTVKQQAEALIKQGIRGKSSDNLTVIVLDLEAPNDRITQR